MLLHKLDGIWLQFINLPKNFSAFNDGCSKLSLDRSNQLIKLCLLEIALDNINYDPLLIK
jgi:hypothetical protein